jgi:[acyl-carrier-protein] S-malonyltransferase
MRSYVELGPGGVLTGLARRVLDPVDASPISVATPDDLEKLAEVLTGAEPYGAFNQQHAGERFAMTERLLVSPSAGLFQPIPELVEATPGVRGAPHSAQDEARKTHSGPRKIEVGDLIGHVGDREIRSAFAGRLEGVLVLPGERVLAGQPVAWVRPGADDRSEGSA